MIANTIFYKVGIIYSNSELLFKRCISIFNVFLCIVYSDTPFIKEVKTQSVSLYSMLWNFDCDVIISCALSPGNPCRYLWKQKLTWDCHRFNFSRQLEVQVQRGSTPLLLLHFSPPPPHPVPPLLPSNISHWRHRPIKLFLPSFYHRILV